MVGAQDMWPIFCRFAFGQGKGDAPVWMTPQLPGTWCFPQHFSVSVHLFILDPAFAYQALCQAPGWWLETPAESVFPSDSLVFFICVTHSWFNSSKSFPPSHCCHGVQFLYLHLTSNTWLGSFIHFRALSWWASIDGTTVILSTKDAELFSFLRCASPVVCPIVLVSIVPF